MWRDGVLSTSKARIMDSHTECLMISQCSSGWISTELIPEYGGTHTHVPERRKKLKMYSVAYSRFVESEG